MIVYSATKKKFVEDVRNNIVHEEILAEMRRRNVNGGSESEIASWRNSMQFMERVVNDEKIPDNAGVSIEYCIPLSSKRIDFILTGKDQNRNDTAIIIELKQWSKVSTTSMDGIVNTFVGKGLRDTNHPSYQAWTYAAHIEDYNQTVQNEAIKLRPCAYCHNMDSDEAINDPFYKDHTSKAPVFISKDAKKLNAFLRKFVKHGDTNDIMYRIDHGKIKPSKNLADCLVSMLEGNTEFLMIDDQKLVYEKALSLSYQLEKNNKKQVLIVEGGPGTGKSVVAINLLVELTKQQKIAQYVSKNSAPRAVYCARLKGSMTKGRIDNLFKGSASYTGMESGQFDVLIVDEAHRLMAKNRYNKLSENQVKELIHASMLSIFFIDEDQVVTWNDVGTKSEIHKWANDLGAEVQEMQLESQFRCNGSNGYLAWLDDVLRIKATANQTVEGVDYEFKTFADPCTLRQAIRDKNLNANKARIVAGYCWDWISDSRKAKNNSCDKDIVLKDYGFKAQWNLSQDGSLWIIKKGTVNEVGCIHTCQGLELDYVGVIIGPDLVVRNGDVITDAKKRSKMDSSIRGYKKLLKEQPDKARQKADRIIKNTYRTLMTRGQKGCYVFSVDPETNAYFQERGLAAFSDANYQPGEKYTGLHLEIVEVTENQKYVEAIPLMNIKAAAGLFGETTFVEECDWVRLPEPFQHKEGYFVAQVLGDSMNKRIPNGSWCLFKPDQGGSREGKIVLVEMSEIQDSETGSRFTVKQYRSEKNQNEDGAWRHSRILLEPVSNEHGYKPIVLGNDEIDGFKVVGEFVAVVG